MVMAYHFLFFSWMDSPGAGGMRDVISIPLNYPEAMPFTWWGWVGVEVFFVISGFVITISASNKTSIKFLIDRFCRIYPALVFFTLISFTVILRTNSASTSDALRRLANTMILWPKGPWVDGVVWTLVTEAIFYLAITLAISFRSYTTIEGVARYALMTITLFWVIVILHFSIGLGNVGTAALQVATSFGARVALLTTGGFFLLGIYGSEVFLKGLSAERVVCLSFAFVCCIMAIITRAMGTHGVSVFHQSPIIPVFGWIACLGICVTAMIYEQYCAYPKGVKNAARTLGLITYPLYLAHEITGGWILGRLSWLGFNRWVAAFLAGLIIFGISYVFTIWIEPKIRKLFGFDRLKAWSSVRTARY